MKQNITPVYAVEYAGHRLEGWELTVYAAGKHIAGRGDSMNIGLITVRLTSPMEDVIHVELTHFEGGSEVLTRPQVRDAAPEVSVTETDAELVFRSGNLRAVICKEPSRWGIAYCQGDRRLTATGYRNQAQMRDSSTGKAYMVEQLELGVGEYVYGLGEQFTPFVKNGQSVGIWNEDGGTASQQAYKSIPFYLSSRGYGVLVDTFPDPAGMLRRYHDNGLKICVWINPYIAQQSYLFREGMEQGYLVRKTDGSVWQTDLWQPGMALVDFTNPDAVRWYQDKLAALLDMGVDCFKTDFGERVPVRGIQWFNGADPMDMHNYYTYLYNQAVFTLLEERKGAGGAVLFARSATVGGQQFPAHWGGDCAASYPSMAETLRGGLSLACSGFGFWSHDISGFEQTAAPDLYKRWCQFGLLSSHSRLHGSGSYRVPWNFDEEACVVLREMVELKCALMPYLYRQAVIAHDSGVPMLRPMFLEFPEDRSCLPLDMQYMLGDSLLAAPIFREDGEVEYYLPAGKWVNLLTRQVLEGPGWHRGVFDYHALPLMVRPNSILPMGGRRDRPDYDYTQDVTLCLSCFEDGGCAEIEIPGLNGQTVMRAGAVRRGDRIELNVSGGGSWKCRLLEDLPAVIEQTEAQAVITLT